MIDDRGKVIRPKRKGLRLPDVDYSTEGYYFVTICVADRKCILGDVIGKSPNAIFVPSQFGNLLQNAITQLPYLLPVRNDVFQIMPNHFHINLEITDRPITVGAGSSRPQTTLTEPKFWNYGDAPLTLGKILGYFKHETTKIYNDYLNLNCGRQDGAPTIVNRDFRSLWQRNYFERIIRDDNELGKLKYYIEQNPNDWNHDEENPNRTHKLD